MKEFLNASDIPLPPYPVPESLNFILSSSIMMEEICKKYGLRSLSAPRIGIASPILVYWSNYPSDPKIFSCIVEPTCFGSGDKSLSIETYPNLPGQRFAVMRYPTILFCGKKLDSDESGRLMLRTFEENKFGLEAATLQHEIDQIMGISLESSGERIFFR